VAIMAKVLVGIPTRNRPKYAPEAIQSVLNQTLRDIRVVVSDDASEQSASETVQSFIQQLGDPRVSYHHHPVSIKEYGQGRFLFKECVEEYFAIFHDDDVLDPKYLEVMVDILDRNPSVAFAVADPYVFDAEGRRRPDLTQQYFKDHGRGRYPEGKIEILVPLFSYGLFPISGTLFRASALRESSLVDPDCDGNFPFEFNVFIRLGELGKMAYYYPRELIGFRFHERSLRSTEVTGFTKGMVETIIKILERRKFSGLAERLRKKTLAYNCRNYAMICFVAQDRRTSFRFLARALRLNPLSWRNWVYAALAAFCPFMIKPLFGPRAAL
jgi:glycosyltransferase involved in cell wall biosynthesis